MIYTLILFLNLFSPTTVDSSISSKSITTHTATQKKDVDISGFWEGTITRDEGFGKRVNFDIEVILTQKGKEITGVSIVRAVSDNKTYNAKMELVGKLKGGYLKYSETKILSFDPIPDAEWCIKKVELIYKNTNNMPTLEGIWEGVTTTSSETSKDKTGASKVKDQNCIPGRVALKRKPPRV